MPRSVTVPSWWDRFFCWVFHDHVHCLRGDYRYRGCSTPGCCRLVITRRRVASWWHGLRAGAR